MIRIHVCNFAGNMSAKRLPQLVILTFDDSVNDLNKGLYQVSSAINWQTHNMFYTWSWASSIVVKSIFLCLSGLHHISQEKRLSGRCEARGGCVTVLVGRLHRKWWPGGGNGLGFIAGNDWHILISKMLLTHLIFVWNIFIIGQIQPAHP